MINFNARIQAIYLASAAGMPMNSMDQVKVGAGLGIEGDR